VILVLVYAEALVGEGQPPERQRRRTPAAPLEDERQAKDGRTAVTTGEVVNDIGPGGPYLDGLDALIAAVGCELDAQVVSVRD
jgi:hypothetical protein